MDTLIKLYKQKGKNTRYYRIQLYFNLFNEYLIEREYGNITFKRYTGKRVNIFKTKKEAFEYINKIKTQKVKKGYGYQLPPPTEMERLG